jgi:hypothetical protein
MRSRLVTTVVVSGARLSVVTFSVASKKDATSAQEKRSATVLVQNLTVMLARSEIDNTSKRGRGGWLVGGSGSKQASEASATRHVSESVAGGRSVVGLGHKVFSSVPLRSRRGPERVRSRFAVGPLLACVRRT